MADTTSSKLSVLVPIVSDTTDSRVDVANVAGCLEALAQQIEPPPMEIIVIHLPDVEGLDAVKARFSSARFLAVPDVKGPRETGGGREHHDVLRARGLALAQGEIVALIEDYGRPYPHWAANIMNAQRESYACIGGAMGNSIDRPLNWAVYFCDYGRYQNPLPEGPSPFASDANMSFKRAALERIRDTWSQAFREIIVNGTLMELGEKVVLRRDILVNQCRLGLKFWPAMRERFVWGKSYAASRNMRLSLPKRLVLAALSPVLPFVLTLRLARTALSRRIYFDKFLGSVPLIFVLLLSWTAGEGIGYVTGVRQA